jgi:hypothetical protein
MFALLVGLWAMHGMSGATGAGCQGTVMSVTSAAPMTGTVHRMAQPQPAKVGQTGAVLTAAMDRMRHGELCLSAQPPPPGGALLALLAMLVLAACGVGHQTWISALGVALRRWRWRAPPGPGGMRLLTVVCVSRT